MADLLAEHEFLCLRSVIGILPDIGAAADFSPTDIQCLAAADIDKRIRAVLIGSYPPFLRIGPVGGVLPDIGLVIAASPAHIKHLAGVRIADRINLTGNPFQLEKLCAGAVIAIKLEIGSII